MLRVVLTGGRDYEDSNAIWEALDAVHEEFVISELITGACPYGGADLHAENWAKDREVDYRGLPAKFKTAGKPAGPARNQRMIETQPDIVIFAPGGKGTANCIGAAMKAGIPVFDLKLQPVEEIPF